MTEHKYSEQAVERARDGALEWLQGNNGDGYPRTWEQEHKGDQRRGYVMYEFDWEAPPIAGYEALEREGLVARQEIVVRNGEERVHFRLMTLNRGEKSSAKENRDAG